MTFLFVRLCNGECAETSDLGVDVTTTQATVSFSGGAGATSVPNHTGILTINWDCSSPDWDVSPWNCHLIQIRGKSYRLHESSVIARQRKSSAISQASWCRSPRSHIIRVRGAGVEGRFAQGPRRQRPGHVVKPLSGQTSSDQRKAAKSLSAN